MTDPQNPGEKPDIDDVVERANAGLAEAEAAGRAATEPPAPTQDAAQASAPEPDAAAPDASTPDASTPDASGPAAAEPAAASADVRQNAPEPTPASADVEPESVGAAGTAEAAAPEPQAAVSEPAAEPASDEPASARGPVAETAAYPRPGDDAVLAAAAAGTASAPAASTPAASAPVEEPTGLTAVAGPRPVYVSAPEPPNPRGNRGAAGLIGLVAAVSFAVLYLAVWTLIDLVGGSFDAANLGNRLVFQLSQPDVWTPTIVFFLGFWLLGVFVNRGRWGYWVVFGILVGAAAYIGHIAGQLAHAQAWNLSYAASEKLVHAQLFAPMAIAAFIIGRELTIWFGAWVAARGRRITALNTAAQEEYERSLEAGPQAAAGRD